MLSSMVAIVCADTHIAPKKKTRVKEPEEVGDEEEEVGGDEEDDEEEVDEEEVELDDDDEDTADKSGPAKSDLKNKGAVPEEKDLAEVDDAE
jgi:hypothetical protein